MLPAVKARQPHPGPLGDRTGRGAQGPSRAAVAVRDRRTIAACPRKQPLIGQQEPFVELPRFTESGERQVQTTPALGGQGSARSRSPHYRSRKDAHAPPPRHRATRARDRLARRGPRARRRVARDRRHRRRRHDAAAVVADVLAQTEAEAAPPAQAEADPQAAAGPVSARAEAQRVRQVRPGAEPVPAGPEARRLRALRPGHAAVQARPASGQQRPVCARHAAVLARRASERQRAVRAEHAALRHRRTARAERDLRPRRRRRAPPARCPIRTAPA